LRIRLWKVNYKSSQTNYKAYNITNIIFQYSLILKSKGIY